MAGSRERNSPINLLFYDRAPLEMAMDAFGYNIVQFGVNETTLPGKLATEHAGS